jgi:hypothetical protein
MNHSIYSADRATHLKIVVVALLACTTVAGIGIAARMSGGNSADGMQQLEARIPVIKAGAPMTVTSSETRTVR